LKPVIVLRHAAHVPIGSLEQVLARAGVPQASVDLFAEIPKTLPLDEAAGLVILGGPMNVDEVDAHPFLLPKLDWIRDVVDRELPTLGICLGAQLLAKALGKRVFRNPVKEIGWYEVELLPAARDDRLFGGRGPVETVFQWHGDTFDLPDGAAHLARGQSCSSQAFRAGRSAYGVQFHVEMTPELIDEWLEEPHFSAEVAAREYIDPAAIRAQVPQRIAAMDSFSQCLLGRFAAWCRQP
jgi:GMP synthase-like glutamine amidotransferase